MGINYNVYEHEKMKLIKELHPDWIWNRGDTHVILGMPGCLEAFKTPVEPGNSFSPGPGTYGVSSWFYVEGKLHAPEEKELSELVWSFEEGSLPVLNSKWKAGNISVSSNLFTDGDYESSNYKNYFTVELTNNAPQPLELSFYLVLRSFGAAGGPIKSLSYKDNIVYINGAPLVFTETQTSEFGALSYSSTKEDISVYLKNGVLPKQTNIEDDESTWASGALEFKVKLESGQKVKYDFAFHLHTGHWTLDWIKPLERPLNVDKIKKNIIKRWKEELEIRLDLPDRRFADALNCQLTHLYMFTVANSIRITPISYPLWWLRDGAYILNALNKGGLHDFCERACREIAEKDAFGGFGSEGDGPSDGIWLLSEHYMLTEDKEFLKDMFPHIKRRAELLMKMRRTKTPIKIFTEYTIPKCMLEPNTDILCIAAEDGLIKGRMDHHFPTLWINGFAYLALKRTAICARALGIDDSLYENEAEDLLAALMKKAEKIFGQNDRDVNSAFWPTGWASRDDKFINEKFYEFWNKVRCPNGKHSPDSANTYFEAGQAHNFLLLGKRENAWVSIEWFLSNQTAPGLYTYPEGIDDNTDLLWPRLRGWEDVNYVTPHGWTAAEVFHLLRDCLVREDGEMLIIGSGIPECWMNEKFEVKGIPTYFGKVSFSYTPGNSVLAVEVERIPKGGIKADFAVPVILKVIDPQ
jgi:hypothetical protein